MQGKLITFQKRIRGPHDNDKTDYIIILPNMDNGLKVHVID